MIEPVEKGYWKRPDLGIGPSDIRIAGNQVTVRVHSLGAMATPITTLVLKDAQGRAVDNAKVPPLEAPLDLIPRWTDIAMSVPDGTDLSSGSVQVHPEGRIIQITRRNTYVNW